MKTFRFGMLVAAGFATVALTSPSELVAGGLPAIGVGAFARGQGPVGANGFSIGRETSNQGFRFVGRGYGRGYPRFYAGAVAPQVGGAAVYNNARNTAVAVYNQRRDGGFYGGGGVFYGDNGYSRLPPPINNYTPSQHVIYLPDNEPGGGK
jgi:hypothetical protein